MEEQTKILWIDCETTGLEYKKHDIWQLGCLVDIDGKVVDEKNFKMRPRKGSIVSKKTLDFLHIDMEYLKSLPHQDKVFNEEIIPFLEKHVHQYDKTDKFYLGGYNVAHFDEPFFQELFKKQGHEYYGSFFNHKKIDPFTVIQWLHFLNKIPRTIKNLKLETLCEHFGIPLEHAHDAVDDVKATRELAQLITLDIMQMPF